MVINSMEIPPLQKLNNLITEISTGEYSDSLISLEEGIEAICGITSDNPKIVANSFDSLLDILLSMVQAVHSSQCSLIEINSFIEVIKDTIEFYPSVLKKHPNRLNILIRVMLQMLSSISYEVSQTWLNPPQGHKQEDMDDDGKLVSQVMNYMDQIASTVGYNWFLQQSQSLLIQWFHSNCTDWRFKHASLMLISQLGETIQNISKIQPFIDIVLLCANEGQAKLRYAMLHVIGQFSDDMKPDFQEKYTDKIFPMVLNLAKDPIARVHSHALACMCNFLEEYDDVEKLLPYMEQIMTTIKYFSEHGCSSAKENALSVVASLGSSNGLFNINIQQAIQIIENVFVNHCNQPMYSQLINQTLQALTILISSQQKCYTTIYLPMTINVMVNLSQKISHDYYLVGWKRLCISFNSFTPLEPMMNILIPIIQFCLNQGEQDAECALSALMNTISSFKNQFKPYILSTIQLARQNMSKYTAGNAVRNTCLQILQRIISSISSQAPDPQLQNVVTEIIKFYLDEIQNHTEMGETEKYEEIRLILNGIKTVVTEMGFLIAQSEYLPICSQFISYGNTLNSRMDICLQQIKQQNNLIVHNNEIDDEEKDQIITQLNNKISHIQDAMLIIPDLIDSIIKRCSDAQIKMQILGFTWGHAQNYLEIHSNNRNKQYGLYYVDNIIDCCVYQQLAGMWEHFDLLLMQHTQNNDSQIRNSAVYGLGAMFLKIPNHLLTASNWQKWIHVLSKALSISPVTNDKTFKHAQDNVVSTLGKLIKAFRYVHSSLIDRTVYHRWLSLLPLNNDMVEGNIQQQYLIEILQTQPSIIISNCEDLLTVLKIYCKFAKKRTFMKQQSDQIIQKTKKSLELFRNWPLFQTNSDYLWNQLSSREKFILKLMTK